ncbi:MAG: hypothetical protein DMG77_18670 [Acidobacteria bacterium]|nr:MAG: hypothetical protein DMG77_18670 [Acidobacteriota bacterium]
MGRASLTMGKPSSPVETLKITLSGAGGAKGKLLIEWENVTASAPFSVRPHSARAASFPIAGRSPSPMPTGSVRYLGSTFRVFRTAPAYRLPLDRY